MLADPESETVNEYRPREYFVELPFGSITSIKYFPGVKLEVNIP